MFFIVSLKLIFFPLSNLIRGHTSRQLLHLLGKLVQVRFWWRSAILDVYISNRPKASSRVNVYDVFALTFFSLQVFVEANLCICKCRKHNYASTHFLKHYSIMTKRHPFSIAVIPITALREPKLTRLLQLNAGSPCPGTRALWIREPAQHR